MKRTVLVILMFCLIFPLFADDKKVEDKEIKEISLDTKNLEDRAKIGVALGYPSGVVFGYRLANFLEVNALLGTFYNGFTVGGNLMFTIADIKIKDQSFPLSLGPHVNFHMGDNFDMSLMGFIRWEYTFEDIPLNLYLEGGPGIFLLQGIDLTWSTSLGIRYVF